MLKLAFVGSAGSGKTTLAKYLAVSDYQVVLSFATDLKDEIASACAAPIGGLSTEDVAARFRLEMDHPEHKRYWRGLMQWWGTDLRRDRFGEDYWTSKMARRLDDIPTSYTGIYVDDCRFPDEYDLLKARGFTFVALEQNPDEIMPLTPDHVSEQYWHDFEVAATLPWDTVAARVGALLIATAGKAA